MNEIQLSFRGGISFAVCCCVAAFGACTQAPPPPSMGMSTQLVFLTRVGCENTEFMRVNLDTALQELRIATDYQVIDIGALPGSDPRSGYPTPTVLYDNRDLFGMPEPALPHPPAT